jgi:hypothetical protein
VVAAEGGGAAGAAAAPLPPQSPSPRKCASSRETFHAPGNRGDSLGVERALTCNKCHQGSKYHCKCLALSALTPHVWGANGTALPGSAAEGQRITGDCI